ncbi:MAG TPA: ELWxxDGT repeat protein [Thermoanaerobaculia bacterium]|jgi:ELWxxDGT repeat protein|nr:ELWxxDGT repeat protein [Thermoanaerobaculia bacterium]
MRFGLFAALLSLCLAAPAVPASAEPAHLVADLNPALVPFDESVAFKSFTPLGGRVLFLGFFFAGDNQCGLWSTDGTAAGTGRLADLCAESLSPANDSSRVRILGVAGPLVFLTDSLGRLWRTDGTAIGAGTFSLGIRVSAEHGLPVLGPGGILYFVSCDAAGDCQPWRSDGTAAGTEPLAHVELDPGGIPFFQFVVQGNHVVFSSLDSQGAHLWTTDGTPDGTRQLALFQNRIGAILPVGGALYVSTGGSRSDVWLVPAAGSPVAHLGSFPVDFRGAGVPLLQAGGRVLIQDFEGDGVASLWEIPASNRRVRFLARFENGMGPVAEVGGRLVFGAAAAGNGSSFLLWSLGPKAVHPRPVSGCPGGCPKIDLTNAGFSLLGGRALFAGVDHRGSELWQTDGTGTGTRLVKDLCPGNCASSPRDFGRFLGRLLFTAAAGDLWVTDGTPAGTRIVSRTAGGLDFAGLGSRVVFSGLDSFAGAQPWVSDLTVAGTHRIDILGGGLAAGSAIQSLTPFGSGVLFGTCPLAGGTGLWHSDGTAGGTERLLDAGQGCGTFSITPFVTAGGLAFFSLDRFHLWRTDGTPAGSQILTSLGGALLPGFLPLDGGLFFVAGSTTNPQPPFSWDFWRSDGTPQGTLRTGSVTLSGGLVPLAAVGSTVLFFAQRNEPPFPDALWRTDGTTAGTGALLNLSAAPGPPDLVPLNGKALLVVEAAGRPVGRELWTTDGTAAGTVPVISSLEAPRPLNPRGLGVLQGTAYFFADTGDPARPLSLWRSDGTEAGTSLVADFAAPSDPTALFSLSLTPAGDFLFFALDDGVHGEELWRTDGTAAGTVLVRDIAPGAAHGRPEFLTAADGRLYFTATDGEHGLELWTSDGTAEGTVMVQDILPGPTSSWPQNLVAADGNLFFTAVDGVHGRELWVLPLEP